MIIGFLIIVCIRYYYNSSEKKYYTLEDEKFSWPHLEHGISQRNNIYLTTIIQKCSNDSIINKIFGECPSQKEIDDYVSKYFGIYLYFTDTQVDPTNYKNPVQKYLQTINTGIGTPQTYVESYIHYSPIKVRTNEGALFGATKEINSFYFDFNRKGSANNDPKYFIITKYYHLMQNNVQIYERKYNNIFDLLSEIGGVVQFIFYIFYFVNYFYNKYVITYDTNSLFFSVKDNQIKEIKEKNGINKVIIKNNSNNSINIQNLNTININYDRNKNVEKVPYLKLKKSIIKYSSVNNSDKGMKIKINLNDSNNHNNSDYIIKKREHENINENKNNNNYFNLNNINLKQDFFKPNQKGKMGIDINSSSLDLKGNNNNLSLENSNVKKVRERVFRKISNKDCYNKIFLSKNSISKIEHIKKRERKINKIGKIRAEINLSFFTFLRNLCFEKSGSARFIIKFRKHLLSEEHLFKAHLKTILLEKEFNSKIKESVNIFECFSEL